MRGSLQGWRGARANVVSAFHRTLSDEYQPKDENSATLLHHQALLQAWKLQVTLRSSGVGRPARRVSQEEEACFEWASGKEVKRSLILSAVEG